VPTYEYRCKDCGNDLEVVQAFTDDALTMCEVCGGRLRKLFGNVGIAFKGSGFYKNDSRGKSTTTAANGDKASSDSGSGDKGTSEKSTSDTSTATKDAGASPKKDTSSKDAGTSNGSGAKTSAPAT
jgi:putative FmdB family regulatory protein